MQVLCFLLHPGHRPASHRFPWRRCWRKPPPPAPFVVNGKSYFHDVLMTNLRVTFDDSLDRCHLQPAKNCFKCRARPLISFQDDGTEANKKDFEVKSHSIPLASKEFYSIQPNCIVSSRIFVITFERIACHVSICRRFFFGAGSLSQGQNSENKKKKKKNFLQTTYNRQRLG